MIAFINIVVLMTMLGHGKYQYLFCREIQGKIICPHECPLDYALPEQRRFWASSSRLCKWTPATRWLQVQACCPFILRPVQKIAVRDRPTLKKIKRIDDLEIHDLVQLIILPRPDEDGRGMSINNKNGRSQVTHSDLRCARTCTSKSCT